MSATLYGVGIGPGDPELLTLKAKRVLEETPVIAIPKAKSEGGSLAFDVIKRIIKVEDKEVLELTFPMKKEKEDLQSFWDDAKNQVLGYLMNGKDVAFVTIGDPMLHSTFIYLMEALNKGLKVLRNFKVKVIPGVSSVNAASASASIPLVRAGERLAILPATYEEKGLKQTLRDFDTVVLMKVNRVMDKVLDILEELGLKDNGVFISKAGWDEEEVVRNLDSLKGKEPHYFSMIIVKKS